MAKGETFKTPITEMRDEQTGRVMHKLSSWDDAHCVATYFYYQPMSADERYIAFGSDRTGRFELYRMDLAAGETVQLTEHDASLDPKKHEDIWRCHVHPNGRELLFNDTDGLRAIDLHSLEERLVCGHMPSELGNVTYIPNATPDGRFSIGKFKEKDGPSGLLRVDLAGGREPEVIYRHDNNEEYVGHVVPATVQGILATFSLKPDRQRDPTASYRQRARAWRLGDDGSAEPFLVMPVGTHGTHPYWGPDGRFYCHKKTHPTWTPTWIISVDGETGKDYQEHFRSDDRKLGHSFITPDAKWIVSDVQDNTGNELYLINRNTGDSEILCWPNSTVDASNNQLSHVHPWFSPSGRHVGFTSDRSGKAAVFLLPDVL